MTRLACHGRCPSGSIYVHLNACLSFYIVYISIRGSASCAAAGINDSTSSDKTQIVCLC